MLKIISLAVCTSLFAVSIASASEETREVWIRCNPTGPLETGKVVMELDSSQWGISCSQTTEGYADIVTVDPGSIEVHLNASVYKLNKDSDWYEYASSAQLKYWNGNLPISCKQVKQDFAVKGLAALYRYNWHGDYANRYSAILQDQFGFEAQFLLPMKAQGSNEISVSGMLSIDGNSCSVREKK